MDIDKYYSELDKLSIKIEDEEISVHNYIENLFEKNDNLINELIDFRKEFIDSNDNNKVFPFLGIGFFRNLKGLERTTCFVINFEICEIKEKNNWKRRCELYSEQHPLFVESPDLFSQIRKKNKASFDLELINNKAFEQINESEILKIKDSNKYAILETTLNPIILTWTKNTFPKNPIYIRAKPHKVYNTKPQQLLLESILIPANPNWWKNLTIHNRIKTGASYVLDDCDPHDNYRQYWELHIKKINRLEIIAKRNNDGNLSMMIEELTHTDSNGLVFGRMIHLDTDAKYGSEFKDAELNHLDLAINIYQNETANTRLEENLANGNKTIDATYRTHLLRVENIPFKSLFAYVSYFLKSQTLMQEWFEDQFV